MMNTLIDTTGRERETLGVFHKYEGRRHVQPIVPNSLDGRRGAAVKEPWNFLQGGQGPDVAPGVSSERTTKYHKGFQRRQHEAIRPETERYLREHERALRHFDKAPLRTQHLAFQDTRYGDVVHTSDGMPHMPFNRKHFPQREVGADDRLRQMNTAGRYYVPPDPNKRDLYLDRMEKMLASQRQASSIIGVGKRELPSMGTWDNFQGPEEVEKHVAAQRTKIRLDKIKPRPF